MKEGTFVRLQSRWKSFRNPWTKDIEFLVAKNAYIEYISLEFIRIFRLRNQLYVFFWYPRTENVDVTSPCIDSASTNFSNNEMFYSGKYIYSRKQLVLHDKLGLLAKNTNPWYIDDVIRHDCSFFRDGK